MPKLGISALPKLRSKEGLLKAGFLQSGTGGHLMTSAGTVKQAYLFPLNETEGRFLLDAIGLLALSGHGKTADRLPGQTQRAQFVQARVGQCKFH